MAEWKRIKLPAALQNSYKCLYLYKHTESSFDVFSRYPLKGLLRAKPQPSAVSWREYMLYIKSHLASWSAGFIDQEWSQSGLFAVNSVLHERLRTEIEMELYNYAWIHTLPYFIYQCCIVHGYVPQHLHILDYDEAVQCVLPQLLPIVLCQLVGQYLLQYFDNQLLRSNGWFQDEQFADALWAWTCKVNPLRIPMESLSHKDISELIRLQQGPLPDTFRHFIVSQFWFINH